MSAAHTDGAVLDASDATASSSSSSFLTWKCPICLDTLERPVLTTCCGQSFCDACLNAALAKTDACPMCREPLLSGRHSVTRNRALEELLARLPDSMCSSQSDSDNGDYNKRSVVDTSIVERGHEAERELLLQIEPSGDGTEASDERRRHRRAWQVVAANLIAQARDKLRR